MNRAEAEVILARPVNYKTMTAFDAAERALARWLVMPNEWRWCE